MQFCFWISFGHHWHVIELALAVNVLAYQFFIVKKKLFFSKCGHYFFLKPCTLNYHYKP